MLSFLQLNLHKATQASMLLGQELAGKSQTVCLITEPHTNYGKVTGMPGGTQVISATPEPHQPGPRAAIVASRDLQIQALSRWCTRDSAVATAKLHGKQVLIASIYLDINHPVVPDWLDDLMTMASSKNTPLLIGMDSNAHSSLFGPSNNNRGDELEDFILQHSLQVHNSGSDPTYETRRGACLIQTHIDVTLSRGLHFEITAWRVDRSYNASDHNTIKFEATSTPTTQTTIRPWSKANWGAFRDALQQADYRVPTGISMKKLDRLLARLYSLLQDALDLALSLIHI